MERGRDANRPFPYVRMLDIRDNNDGTYTKTKESQIWNSTWAYQHPYLAWENNFNEVGISLGYGGPSVDPTPLVGFVGDSTLYKVNSSNTSLERWGDYSAIRRHNAGNSTKMFSVSNYYLKSATPNVYHQYILFGRPSFLNWSPGRFRAALYTIRITAATGTATIAPIGPSRNPAASTRKIENTGVLPSARRLAATTRNLR